MKHEAIERVTQGCIWNAIKSYWCYEAVCCNSM